MTWTQDPEAVARVEKLIKRLAATETGLLAWRNDTPDRNEALALKTIIAPPVDPDRIVIDIYNRHRRCLLLTDTLDAIAEALAKGRELAEQDIRAAVEREREAIITHIITDNWSLTPTQQSGLRTLIRNRSQEGE